MIIEKSIKKQMVTLLAEIEKKEDIHIFYACESGSRAWGFPSADSDYDVRFLYVHPRDWYLSLDEGPDVIERPIDDKIDISGWDLKKALELFRKSNPPILEWLQSPIIYLEKSTIAQHMRKLLPEFYSPIACLYHYLHMAQRNFREYLKGDTVWIKKYFYVLRPILACRWIEADLGPVPMEFKTLVDRTVNSKSVKVAISDLLKRKQSGEEFDRAPQIPVLSNFIESALERLEKQKFGMKKSKGDTEKLNRLFRSCLLR